jgi:uncharacterized protein (DUF433 family)
VDEQTVSQSLAVTGVISAFTEQQAARLTGLTVHRLRHWDKTGFFAPSLKANESRASLSRVYTFRDLLVLQVLKALRVDRRCSLQHLREVRDTLASSNDDFWYRKTIYVLNRKVVFEDNVGDRIEPVSGQTVFPIPLKLVRTAMDKAVRDLSKRDKDEYGKIDRRRNVNHNSPVIAGTRISVASIKRLLEDGYSPEKIMAEYPSLTQADVEAALNYRKGKTAA